MSIFKKKLSRPMYMRDAAPAGALGGAASPESDPMPHGVAGVRTLVAVLPPGNYVSRQDADGLRIWRCVGQDNLIQLNQPGMFYNVGSGIVSVDANMIAILHKADAMPKTIPVDEVEEATENSSDSVDPIGRAVANRVTGDAMRGRARTRLTFGKPSNTYTPQKGAEQLRQMNKANDAAWAGTKPKPF